VPTAKFQSLVVALVLSRLDHENSVLVSLPIHLARRFQSVQNAAARLICSLRRFDHVTDALSACTGCARGATVSFKLSTICTRAFPVAVPRVWNSLPGDITSAPSLLTFRQQLKTYLFRQSFSHLTF